MQTKKCQSCGYLSPAARETCERCGELVGNDSFSCSECGQTFLNDHLLADHRLVEHRLEPEREKRPDREERQPLESMRTRKCERCGYWTPAAREKCERCGAPYSCSYCDLAFMNERHLGIHELGHQRVRDDGEESGPDESRGDALGAAAQNRLRLPVAQRKSYLGGFVQRDLCIACGWTTGPLRFFGLIPYDISVWGECHSCGVSYCGECVQLLQQSTEDRLIFFTTTMHYCETCGAGLTIHKPQRSAGHASSGGI